MMQIITEPLSFRHKSLLAGDRNVKRPFWNSVVSNFSGVKLLNLLHINGYKISASQCPTHYSPAGNCDVLDIVVQKNVWLSEVIVSDILDSDQPPIAFHLLGHDRTTNISDPVDKFTDWEKYQRLASELIYSRIQINLGEEADKQPATLLPL
jgi:hypothetical protein